MHKRRRGRYSSAYMSSAESTPLFTTPISGFPLNSASFAAAPTRKGQSQSGSMDGSPVPVNTTGTLHLPKKTQRRKASSRQSEICTPEGIPEASDEDNSSSDSASVRPSTVESNSLPSSSTVSMPAGSLSPQRAESIALDAIMDPVDQAFERARLTQEQPPKVLQFTPTSRRSKSSGLRVEFANPPVVLSAPDLGLKSPSNLSGSSTSLARAMCSESITPENTRGLWRPPRARTPVIKRGSTWTPNADPARED